MKKALLAAILVGGTIFAANAGNLVIGVPGFYLSIGDRGVHFVPPPPPVPAPVYVVPPPPVRYHRPVLPPPRHHKPAPRHHHPGRPGHRR